jgi:hypothetical protein
VTGRFYRGLPRSSWDHVRSAYQSGAKIEWTAITSVSANLRVAERFAAKEGAGGIFDIKVNDARDIALYSAVPAEFEVLLKPNSRFVVSNGPLPPLQHHRVGRVELVQTSTRPIRNEEVFVCYGNSFKLDLDETMMWVGRSFLPDFDRYANAALPAVQPPMHALHAELADSTHGHARQRGPNAISNEPPQRRMSCRAVHRRRCSSPFNASGNDPRRSTERTTTKRRQLICCANPFAALKCTHRCSARSHVAAVS